MGRRDKGQHDENKTHVLLEKLLVVQLHNQGANQDTIARIVSKGKKWVNDLLRGVPKKKD